MTKKAEKTTKARTTPSVVLVATETFRGTLDNGQEVMVYASVTSVRAGDPVAKKWPGFFKPLS